MRLAHPADANNYPKERWPKAMPRRGDITYQASQSAAAPKAMPLDLIPDEIKREVEEIFLALTKAGSGRMHVEYDTEDEVKEFRRLVQSYCAHRPADVETLKGQFPDLEITVGGPLKFRASPTRNAPKNEMDFRISEVPAPDPAAEDIREATDAVTEAAVVSTAGTGPNRGARK